MFAQGKVKEGELCPCMQGLPNCPYMNDANEDARLTQKGRLQATTVGVKLIHTKPIPQIILVSPLFRTLQTAAIALSTVPQLQTPVVVVEQIRERMGLHVCDKRSDKDKLIPRFGSFDFTGIDSGDDLTFPPCRESIEQTAKRGKAFFLSLRTRPEQSLAIFSHSSFLFNTISRTFETPNPHGMSLNHSFSLSFVYLWSFCTISNLSHL